MQEKLRAVIIAMPTEYAALDLRQMITASIESFLADRSLAESGVQYVAVLEEMISILLEGVLPR